MVLLDREQIKEIIPHRYPFLLIDEVTALVPGKKCIAQALIREDAFWVPGHFPGHPVTPGVLLIEMLAQTGAVCSGSLPENKGKIALFAKIDKAKFKRMVLPGETVVLEVEMVKLRGTVGVGKGVGTVDGELAVTAELTFAYEK